MRNSAILLKSSTVSGQQQPNPRITYCSFLGTIQLSARGLQNQISLHHLYIHHFRSMLCQERGLFHAQGLCPNHHSSRISRRMLVRARNIEKTIYELMEYWQILSNETFTHTNQKIFGNKTSRKNEQMENSKIK